jgi:hypothetical protein
MALRLIEMVLQEKDGAGVRALLNECKVLEHRQIRLADGEVLVRILLDAEQSETVMDLLEKRYSGGEGNRVVILPVEATLPRAQAELEPEAAATSEQSPPEEKPPERIGRLRPTSSATSSRSAPFGSAWALMYSICLSFSSILVSKFRSWASIGG